MQCVTMLCILRSLVFRECAQSSSRRLQGELPAGSVVHAVVHKFQQVWRRAHVILHITLCRTDQVTDLRSMQHYLFLSLHFAATQQAGSQTAG